MDVRTSKVFGEFYSQFINRDYLATAQAIDGFIGVYLDQGQYFLVVWKMGQIWQISSDPVTLQTMNAIERQLEDLKAKPDAKLLYPDLAKTGLMRVIGYPFQGAVMLDFQYHKFVGFTLERVSIKLTFEWPAINRWLYDLKLVAFLSN